jgi:hypothetical protein
MTTLSCPLTTSGDVRTERFCRFNDKIPMTAVETVGSGHSLPANFFRSGSVVAAIQGTVDQVPDVEHLFFIRPARGHSGRTDANAAGFEDGIVSKGMPFSFR